MDGTLIEAWASQKSFKPNDGSDGGDGASWHKQKRSSEPHARTTDPESRLHRKADGREAKLCSMGHVTRENRHGLAVAGMAPKADGTAEREAAQALPKAKCKVVGHRIPVGADKAYDPRDHVATSRALAVTPHGAQNQSPTKTGKR